MLLFLKEKRKPGRPRKSNLAETSAASSPSVRERRKKIPVDENENNVAMAESTDQVFLLRKSFAKKVFIWGHHQNRRLRRIWYYYDWNIGSGIFRLNLECKIWKSKKQHFVKGKRKPGRPRKRALIDSHVPNAPTVVKPPKTITDYFGSISVKYAGDTKQVWFWF